MTSLIKVLSNALTGETIYANLENDAGLIVNGTALEAYNPANIADYAIAMTEQAKPGNFTASTPSIPAGYYTQSAYVRSGATPAADDVEVGRGRLRWNGEAWEEVALVDDVALSVAPLVGMLNQGMTAQSNFPLFTGEAKALSWTIIDQAGDPVPQTGMTHRLTVYTDNTRQVRLFTETGVVIGGDEDNVLSLTTTPANSATLKPGIYHYCLIRIEGPEVVASGAVEIKAANLGA